MTQIYDHSTISSFLKSELDRKKKRNINYSLRAFARDLHISTSRLSEILNKKAGLSEKMAMNLAEHLGLNEKEKKYWFDLVLATTTKNQNIKLFATERLSATKKINQIKTIKESEFKIISDWYHPAILELTELPHFSIKSEWIAEQLAITKDQAAQALERLINLGFLKKIDSRWISSPEAYQTLNAEPSKAIQKFHEQILNKCLNSIRTDSMHERQTHSMILALPKEEMPHFEEKFKLFLNSFWEDLKEVPKNEVYALTIQLAPIRSQNVRTP